MAFSIKREGNLIKLRTDLHTSVEEVLSEVQDLAKDGIINNVVIAFTTKGSVASNTSVVGDSIPMISWLLQSAQTDLQRLFNPEDECEWKID